MVDSVGHCLKDPHCETIYIKHLTVDCTVADSIVIVNIYLVLLHMATNTYFFLLLNINGPK